MKTSWLTTASPSSAARFVSWPIVFSSYVGSSCVWMASLCALEIRASTSSWLPIPSSDSTPPRRNHTMSSNPSCRCTERISRRSYVTPIASPLFCALFRILWTKSPFLESGKSISSSSPVIGLSTSQISLAMPCLLLRGQPSKRGHSDKSFPLHLPRH